MARNRVVSRTMMETKVSAMVVDVNAGQVSTNEYNLVNVGDKKDSKILEILAEKYGTDTEKFVAITARENKEWLFEMDEATFYAYARKLPPRGTSDMNRVN